MFRRQRSAEDEAAALEELFSELPKVIPSLKRSRWTNRWLIVFMVGGSFAFGHAFDHAAAQDRKDQIATCHIVNDNARKFNELIDTLVLRTRQSTTVPAAQKAEALRLYNAARQDVPVCEPPKEQP